MTSDYDQLLILNQQVRGKSKKDWAEASQEV
jgi:hypothetical protein